MTMQFNVGCQLNYSITQFSTFVFNINVINTSYQTILQESLQLHPQLDFDQYVDPASENQYVRVNVPPGDLQISYRATVELSHFYANPGTVTEIQPADLPIDVFHYLYPSRYCQSDRLIRLAASEFSHLEQGYSRVTAICNWIYDNVIYLSGSSGSQTSAYDTATERAGVCRDFAHLGIAFCRALNIPARFVTGYAYGLNPPDFHACFEAYLGHRWYLFDPTRLVPQNGVVRIGTGRDAADVSFATLFGAVQMNQMYLFAEYIPDKNTASEAIPAPTTAAIAIS